MNAPIRTPQTDPVVCATWCPATNAGACEHIEYWAGLKLYAVYVLGIIFMGVAAVKFKNVGLGFPVRCRFLSTLAPGNQAEARGEIPARQIYYARSFEVSTVWSVEGGRAE